MSTAYTILEHADLASQNTLRVAATARWSGTVLDLAALPEVLALPQFAGLPWLVLGEGSNVLFVADYPGVVLRIAAAAIRIEPMGENAALVHAEAGANWDGLVEQSLVAGWAGLENLALIPGLAGAAPIQNIGAYGVELDEFVDAVTALDRTGGRSRELTRAECEFGYRDSRFKREIDRWIVTHLRLRLPRQHALRLDYSGVREELPRWASANPCRAPSLQPCAGSADASCPTHRDRQRGQLLQESGRGIGPGHRTAERPSGFAGLSGRRRR